MSRSLHFTSLGYISFHRHLDLDPSMKFIICDSKNYFCIWQGRKKPCDLFGFRLPLPHVRSSLGKNIHDPQKGEKSLDWRRKQGSLSLV